MRATVMYRAGDVRVTTFPTPASLWAVGLDEVPDGYRAMNEHRAIKVMVKP